MQDYSAGRSVFVTHQHKNKIRRDADAATPTQPSDGIGPFQNRVDDALPP